MNNKEQIYLTKELIDDIEISEIDFDFYDEVGHDYDKTELHIIENKSGRADAYPVKIDRIISILETMKNKGITHVEVDYHTDHIGYQFSGYLIRKSNKIEIIEFEEKHKNFEDKKRRIIELQKQIQSITNEE